jgi:signal transduction histidine kinase/ActR/RegA family two-component response regulator
MEIAAELGFKMKIPIKSWLDRFGAADEAVWSIRLAMAGSLLTLVYEIGFLIFDRRFVSLSQPLVLTLHSIIIGLYLAAVLMAVNVGEFLRQHWKKVALCFSSILIASSAWIAVVTGEPEPLFIALVLFLAGTGPFLCWGETYQAILSVIAVAAFAIATYELPYQSTDPYRWMGITIACAIGLSSTALERRLRRAYRKAQAEAIAARNVAEAASHAKSEFLSSMSHEIRTPMNAILGMAELLTETPLDGQQKKFVSLMRSNGNALLLLINDILDLARVERGLLHLERTEMDVDSVIASVLGMLEVRASEKQLTLVWKIVEGLPTQRIGDPLRLRQILVNLVGNAIKFTERGGVTVMVQAETKSEDLLRFSITDTGIGIPSDKVATIFSSFTQADSSTARLYGGSGLGLAIAARLVALMGGRIWVESEQGVGSTFHFTARLEVQAAPAVKQPAASPSASLVPQVLTTPLADDGQARIPSILIVDDSSDNRLLLRAFFKGVPCALDEAENGRQAVDMFAARRYDLILMDIRMPVMDGYAAIRQIRKREQQLGVLPVPIIALTASSLQEEVRECLASGCSFYVSKPISKAALLDAVSRATATPPVEAIVAHR